MSIRVVINGACGRMGQLLVRLTHEDPDLTLTGALEAPGHPCIGRDVGEVVGAKRMEILVSDEAPPQADVMIDFSSPEGTLAKSKQAAAQGIAVLVGTTGLTPQQKGEIERLADQAAILISPNMSIGVNLLLDLVQRCAELTPEGFDIEIVESHHRHKKDAPSGTAKRLLEAACDGRGWLPEEVANYGREGLTGERPDEEIGVMAVRGGDIVGEHTVMFVGMGERIELTHRAQTREIFARGAIRVAKWLAGKPAGLYTMKDALGL